MDPPNRRAGAWALTVALLLVGSSPATAAQAASQTAYLKASNTEALDAFGMVAISGDTAVVTSPWESGGSAGVNGDESDNSVPSAGAAYVFVRDGSGWSQQAYIKSSSPDANDAFGVIVAISGDVLVLGAPSEASAATGVDGDDTDDSAPSAGAAWVFARSGGVWTQQAYLKASNTDAGDRFSGAASVSGDTIVLGALQEASAATGVGGDESDDSAPGAGAVYVFVRDGATWSQQAYLKASNAQAGDEFGNSVTLSGDTLVVGARGESSAATGVGGAQGDNGAADAGAAYVFVRDGTTWTQQAYLKASNAEAGDAFGSSVDLSGDTAVIGAWPEDSDAAGVGGDPSDNSMPDAGAVYVFVRDGTTWSQQAYLKSGEPDAGDWFGFHAKISGDTVVVSSTKEDSAATGVDGDATDDSASWAGAAYVFRRTGTTWSQLAYLKASNTEADDRFAWTVDISEDTVITGGYGEDSAATGVDGDQSDNSAAFSGAAWVFDLDTDGPWEDLGSALAGTNGEPALQGTGTLIGGDPMSMALTDARESAPAFLFVGLGALDFSPFYGGTLVPDFLTPPGLLLIVFTDGAGELTLGTSWPTGLPSGLELYVQSWIDDPAGPFGFAASNAIRGTTP